MQGRLRFSGTFHVLILENLRRRSAEGQGNVWLWGHLAHLEHVMSRNDNAQ